MALLRRRSKTLNYDWDTLVLVPDLLTVGSGVPIAIVTTNAVSDFATIPIAF